MLFAIVAELSLPRGRRGGVVAMIAVTGFAYSLATAAYRWIYGVDGPAYHGYATGDTLRPLLRDPVRDRSASSRSRSRIRTCERAACARASSTS